MMRPTRLVRRMDGWRLVVMATAAVVAMPLSVILFSFFRPEPEIWRHMAENLIFDLFINTGLLAVGVLVVTSLLGVSLAWLTGVCEFPGRRIFDWALLMPLAVPTYVLAFVFLGIFDFSGPVQSALNALFPNHAVSIPDIRNAPGMIMVMSLALYPYVYLLSKNAFMTQGGRAMEAARALGAGGRAAFFRVALPMARPWIFGGLMLVLMETLADFGAVSIFNYDTFTTAIYKAWFGFFSLTAAAQLSSILVFLVFGLVLLEGHAQRRMRFNQTGRMTMEVPRIRLKGWRGLGAAFYAGTVTAIGFVVPFLQLIVWSVDMLNEESGSFHWPLLTHSLFLSLTTAAGLAFVALLLAYAGRRHGDRATRFLTRISVMGYALPGTVLAVGLTIVIAFLDNRIIGILEIITGETAAPLLQGTLFVMVTAYIVRFLATGYNALHSAMHRITPSIDEAARIMGVRGLSLLRRVHAPILKGGLITACALVFVDVMKEMPITLMTRPFGWDTLAVKIFELTAEGEWQRAAFPAVILIIGGLIPVAVLTGQSRD